MVGKTTAKLREHNKKLGINNLFYEIYISQRYLQSTTEFEALISVQVVESEYSQPNLRRINAFVS